MAAGRCRFRPPLVGNHGLLATNLVQLGRRRRARDTISLASPIMRCVVLHLDLHNLPHGYKSSNTLRFRPTQARYV